MADLIRAPHSTLEDTMTDETRCVLIKPGDVLLIGGVHVATAEDAQETMRRIKELTGVRAVVAFPGDITIDRLDQLQLLDLLDAVESERDGRGP